MMNGRRLCVAASLSSRHESPRMTCEHRFPISELRVHHLCAHIQPKVNVQPKQRLLLHFDSGAYLKTDITVNTLVQFLTKTLNFKH